MTLLTAKELWQTEQKDALPVMHVLQSVTLQASTQSVPLLPGVKPVTQAVQTLVEVDIQVRQLVTLQVKQDCEEFSTTLE